MYKPKAKAKIWGKHSAWLESIPVIKINHNYFREMSNGVKVAKIVDYFYPNLVHHHNYIGATSAKLKKENWKVLNEQVLGKLGLKMSAKQIDDIIAVNYKAIDQLLSALREKFDPEPEMSSTDFSEQQASFIELELEPKSKTEELVPFSQSKITPPLLQSYTLPSALRKSKTTEAQVDECRFGKIEDLVVQKNTTSPAFEKLNFKHPTDKSNNEQMEIKPKCSALFPNKSDSEVGKSEESESEDVVSLNAGNQRNEESNNVPTFLVEIASGDARLSASEHDRSDKEDISCDEAEIEKEVIVNSEIGEWLASIPLSRKIKKIRDFSNGLLMAEIIQHFQPEVIQNGKYGIENWNSLNNNVLNKIGITLTPEQIKKISVGNAVPIYELLMKLKGIFATGIVEKAGLDENNNESQDVFDSEDEDSDSDSEFDKAYFRAKIREMQAKKSEADAAVNTLHEEFVGLTRLFYIALENSKASRKLSSREIETGEMDNLNINI